MEEAKTLREDVIRGIVREIDACVLSRFDDRCAASEKAGRLNAIADQLDFKPIECDENKDFEFRGDRRNILRFDSDFRPSLALMNRHEELRQKCRFAVLKMLKGETLEKVIKNG